METETKKDLSVSPLPPDCDDDLKYLKMHVDKAVSWQTLSTSLKENMEPLNHSRVETILRAVKAKHSKFRIFKIVDRTRFIINREPVHIIPISSDLVISNRPDKNTAITVPVGSGVVGKKRRRWIACKAWREQAAMYGLDIPCFKTLHLIV
ncbi:hypothetical protein PAAG_00920 [Paracoccidioides lutzii Pb01]|uniref:Uncharacterized protein n=1 Tax=Paracoccidioides lutzii (strain ATCC MYA-826 / Pb01) TaxID=502779 RepID=C1GQX5_PARBA|nr:hypothetical protein PAAG_00920 [Paracoccidioides lutzii Pb01]EEH37999.2 hypothetical protein PAAG_00920 [Paracoccidioides lutzii Pb01]